MTKNEINQVDLDIKKAIEIILNKKESNSSLDFKDYGKINFATNEQLKELFKNLDLSKCNKALSVLASGDQPLNMICKGVLNLDTFDINRLVEYSAIGLKMTAMRIFNYDEFVSFINKIHDIDSVSIIKYIISCSDIKYKRFWDEILYVTKYAGVSPLVISEIDITKANLYCANEELYKKTRANLEEASINFLNIDVAEIPNKLSSYNFIYLSNILDYFLMGQLKTLGPEEILKRKVDLIQKIYNSNLENEGEFIYSYGFGQTKNEIQTLENSFTEYRQMKYELDDDMVLALKKNKL